MSTLVRLRTPSMRPPEFPAAPEDSSASEPAGGPAVYLETFGCQMNVADTGVIAGRLGARGYRRVEDPAHADVILINTCAVREKAEDRVWGRASQLLDHRRRNPDLVIGITGCMAEHLKDRVAERAPHIGLIVGPDGYRDIADLVERARAGETVVETRLDRSEVYEGLDSVADDDGVSAYVTIQRGCDKFCTFCVVPFTRGRERGVPPREVLRAVRLLAEQGYREVVLLGQTVNSYRHEHADFADLLRAVHDVDGIERIRFTSPYPVDFSPRVIEAMATLPKLCPQVHLPVQSGSDPVLERMRRGYARADFVSLVERLRAAVPGIALSTDVLVGFCGETAEDHARTLDLLDEVRFDSAFMFAYSDRGITHASRRFTDDVAPALKKERLAEVIARQDIFTRAAHDRRVGERARVLVAGPARRGDRLLARTAHFQNVLMPLGSGARGDLLDVTITSSTGHSLFAEPVASPCGP